MSNTKPRVGVHKFTSCDGCQLAFLNDGESLLLLSELVEIVHFIEAGYIAPEAEVDIAFVEGSISTPDEKERILGVREKCKYLITIGACATTGGIQALRNMANVDEWVASVYATPEHIKTLKNTTSISKHVKVDLELWGCPVNSRQVISAARDLLFGVMPAVKRDPVCLECKRQGHPCVIVTKGIPCMGPVTQTGCGALCPGVGRGCYACYGPKHPNNTKILSHCFEELGTPRDRIRQMFTHINNQTVTFQHAAKELSSD